MTFEAPRMRVRLSQRAEDTPLTTPANPSVAPRVIERDDSLRRLGELSGLAESVLAMAARHGASQAEAACSESRGLEVGVRLGAVETVEASEDRGVVVTVYFGRRKGSASSADLTEASLRATVEQACAIARFTEEDPCAGLAEPERMASDLREFDRWHPAPIDADAAIAQALACEAAGREADPRIRNSDGASASYGESLSVYANSHGFIGHERATRGSLQCTLIAGEGDAMQRDGDYDIALDPRGLLAAEHIGRRAAERTVARLDPRPIATGSVPVLFAAEVARGLVGHLLAAISGGALYRRASFLLDSMGTRLFPDWFGIEEDPFLPQGWRSSGFDAEGVATVAAPLLGDGVLQHYLLGSYSARKLGLASTGHAGGAHNLAVRANAGGFDDLLRGMRRGLVVTELMGQGVNPVTGDYSRGAAGFWVEGGQIQHAVDGITIAGNLRGMFQAIEAVGDDTDHRSHVACGSILVGAMTVAGVS
jgi:PmbA protein